MNNFNRTTSGFVKCPSLWRKALALIFGGKTLNGVFACITTALLSTFVWLLWPQVCYAFPRAVGEGWLEPRINWLTALCIVTMFEILGRKR